MKKKGIKTNTENKIIKLIEEEGIDNVIPLRVSLVDICLGDIEAGIMLGQLIYWNERGNPQNDGYIYKSATDWYKEARITDSKVRSATKILKELGFVETKLAVARGSRTRFYKLNIENVIRELERLFSINKPVDDLSNEIDLDYEELEESLEDSSTETDSIFIEVEKPFDKTSHAFDKTSHAFDKTSNYTEITQRISETNLNQSIFSDSIKQENIVKIKSLTENLFPIDDSSIRDDSSRFNRDNFNKELNIDNATHRAVPARFNGDESEKNNLPDTVNQKRFLDRFSLPEFNTYEDKLRFMKVEKNLSEDTIYTQMIVSNFVTYESLLRELEGFIPEFFRN